MPDVADRGGAAQGRETPTPALPIAPPGRTRGRRSRGCGHAGRCGGDGGGTPTLTWYTNPDNGGQADLAATCTDEADGSYRMHLFDPESGENLTHGRGVDAMHLFDPESGENLTHGSGVDARTVAPA